MAKPALACLFFVDISTVYLVGVLMKEEMSASHPKTDIRINHL